MELNLSYIFDMLNATYTRLLRTPKYTNLNALLTYILNSNTPKKKQYIQPILVTLYA